MSLVAPGTVSCMASRMCNQAHGRDNKASKTTSRIMLQRAPDTQHAARSTACCLDSLGPRDDPRPPFIDTNSTLLLPTFQSPLYVDFGFVDVRVCTFMT